MTLIGSQEPTLRLVPEHVDSEGHLVIEFARQIGYSLFPYQEQLLIDGLSLDENRRLVAQSVMIVLSRQNGKSEVLEVLVLYGLFVARFRTVLYTAHQLTSVQGFFRRIRERIRKSPLLQGALKPGRGGIKTGNGHWELHLKTGQEAHFRTRTKDGGRGLDAVPLLIVDEVQNYDDTEQAAIEAVTSSARNPQKWYAGSAGGQHSTVMGRLVRQAEDGVSGMVYHGWHASEADDPRALETYIKTNPGLGAILEVSTVEADASSWSPHYFGRERLGIGDYPRPEGEAWVIPQPSWNARIDLESSAAGPLVFVPETTIDFEWSTISAAGRRDDGDIHIEPVAHERGAAWIAPRLRVLAEKHEALGIAIDPKMPTGDRVLAELADMRTRGLLGKVKVFELTADHVLGSFSWILESSKLPREPGSPGWERANPGFRHRGPELLSDSLKVAKVRKLRDKLAWSRQTESDVSALISCCLAGYAVPILEAEAKPTPPRPMSTRELPPGRRRDARSSFDVMSAKF